MRVAPKCSPSVTSILARSVLRLVGDAVSNYQLAALEHEQCSAPERRVEPSSMMLLL